MLYNLNKIRLINKIYKIKYSLNIRTVLYILTLIIILISLIILAIISLIISIIIYILILLLIITPIVLTVNSSFRWLSRIHNKLVKYMSFCRLHILFRFIELIQRWLFQTRVSLKGIRYLLINVIIIRALQLIFLMMS